MSNALAHDFPHPEIHDLGFVVLQLREAMVKFRTDVNLESRRRRLAGLQLKTGHPHRAFDRKNARRGRGGGRLDFKSPRPNFRRLRVERGNEGDKKLIAYTRPIRAV